MFVRKKATPQQPQSPELPVCGGDWPPAEVTRLRDELRERIGAGATEAEVDELLSTMPATPRNVAGMVHLFAGSITATLRATGALETYLANTTLPDEPNPTDYTSMVQNLERAIVQGVATKGEAFGWHLAQSLAAPREEPLDRAPAIGVDLVRYWLHGFVRAFRDLRS